jgi:hypothetical protein
MHDRGAAGVRMQDLLPASTLERLEPERRFSGRRREQKRDEKYCCKQVAFHGASSIG